MMSTWEERLLSVEGAARWRDAREQRHGRMSQEATVRAQEKDASLD